MLNFLLTIFFCSIAYLAGSIPFALLIGKANGVDIRRFGSGNIGATNVTRALGTLWGRTCFLLDFLKGSLPVWLSLALVNTIENPWTPVLTGASAIAGHLWPVWLNFKGGKGVATSLGVVTALSFVCTITAAVIWLAVFFKTRYVSLASICAALSLPLTALILRLFNSNNQPGRPTLVLLVFLAILIIIKHTSNIGRLLNGTESCFKKH